MDRRSFLTKALAAVATAAVPGGAGEAYGRSSPMMAALPDARLLTALRSCAERLVNPPVILHDDGRIETMDMTSTESLFWELYDACERAGFFQKQ